MDSEKECQPKAEKTCLKEEDRKVAINSPRNKNLDKRLKKQKDFDLVFGKGTRIHTKSLTLVYVKSKTLKYGIGISKKHGKAVKRNRIKRILRAVMRNYDKNMNGFYIVILPKVAESYDFKVFDKDIKYALKKGQLLND